MNSKAVATVGHIPVDMLCPSQVTQESLARVHIHVPIKTRLKLVSHDLLVAPCGFLQDNTKPRGTSLASGIVKDTRTSTHNAPP